MRTLVTGASGFSGSIVARMLARGGFDVVGTYRRDTAFLAKLREEPGLRSIQADLVDACALAGPFDAVVHVAASSPGTDVDRIVRDNVIGTFALIDAAVAWESRSFILFSSLSLHGECRELVLDERTPIHNPDAYGASKYLAECRLAEVRDKLPALSLRLPGILGPGAARNWLAGVAARLQCGDSIPAFHLDRPFNNAAYIADVAMLIANVLQAGLRGFDAIVLGARGTTTVRNAIERLADGLSVAARIEPVAATKGAFTLSCERAIARYGYDPMHIDAMIDRYARDVVAAAKK